MSVQNISPVEADARAWIDTQIAACGGEPELLEKESEQTFRRFLEKTYLHSARISKDIGFPAMFRNLIDVAAIATNSEAGTGGLVIDGAAVFKEYYLRENGDWIGKAIDLSFLPGEGVPGYVLKRKHPYVIEHCEAHELVDPAIREALDFHRLLNVPLLNDDEIVGLFEMHDRPKPYTTGDLFRLSVLAQMASNMVVHARDRGQLVEYVTYDTLTGLLRKEIFHQRLERAWEQVRQGKSPMTLLYIDLDCFKTHVNDRYGHEFGDQVLRAIGQRIRGGLRPGDTIDGRCGGDEFVSIVDCAYEDGNQVAQRLLERLGQPVIHRRRVTDEGEVRYQDISVSPQASIGYAKLSPEFGSARECLQLADNAMYCAKRLGKNRIIGHHEVAHLCEHL